MKADITNVKYLSHEYTADAKVRVFASCDIALDGQSPVGKITLENGRPLNGGDISRIVKHGHQGAEQVLKNYGWL
jgi:hypothetical protein